MDTRNLKQVYGSVPAFVAARGHTHLRDALNAAIESVTAGGATVDAVAMIVGDPVVAREIMAAWEEEAGAPPSRDDIVFVLKNTADVMSSGDPDDVVSALGVLLHGAEHHPGHMTPEISSVMARWA